MRIQRFVTVSAMFCILSFAAIYINTSKSAYAHTFSGDETASFLALVDSIKVELQLVQGNLPSNSTLAQEHVEHAIEHINANVTKEIAEKNKRLATELGASLEKLKNGIGTNSTASINEQITNINNILDEILSVRIEKQQQSNSTVQALVIADIVTEALEHYSEALGAKMNPENETHASMSNMSNSGQNMSTTGSSTSMNMSRAKIVDNASYQSSQAFAAKAQELFSIVKSSAPANQTDSFTKIEEGLDQLKQKIDSRTPLSEVENVVHGLIMTNLQIAFKLQVVPEFSPLIISAIAAIVGIAAGTARRNKANY